MVTDGNFNFSALIQKCKKCANYFSNLQTLFYELVLSNTDFTLFIIIATSNYVTPK